MFPLAQKQEQKLAEKWIRTIFLDFANLRNANYTISANPNYETRDSNPHPNGTAPKTAAYTNSANFVVH